MRAQPRRGGMVAGYHQHIRLQGKQARQRSVHRFNDVRLTGKIAVLAFAVGFLDVDEEKVILIPMLSDGGKFVLGAFALKRNNVHTHKPRHAFVHRVHRHASRLQAIGLVKLGQFGVSGKAAQGYAICLGVAGKQFARLSNPLIEQLGGTAGCRGILGGLHRQRRHAGDLRVGIGQIGRKSFAAHHNHETVFLHLPHFNFHTGDFDLGKFLNQRSRFLAGDTACAAVGDFAFGVHSAEIAARCHVARANLKPHPKGRENSASHRMVERVVSEKRKVRRPRTGGYPRANGNCLPKRAFGSQSIHVGRRRKFKFSRAVRLNWQTAQAVHHQQYNFAPVRAQERLQLFKRHFCLLQQMHQG